MTRLLFLVGNDQYAADARLHVHIHRYALSLTGKRILDDHTRFRIRAIWCVHSTHTMLMCMSGSFHFVSLCWWCRFCFAYAQCTTEIATYDFTSRKKCAQVFGTTLHLMLPLGKIETKMHKACCFTKKRAMLAAIMASNINSLHYPLNSLFKANYFLPYSLAWFPLTHPNIARLDRTQINRTFYMHFTILYSTQVAQMRDYLDNLVTVMLWVISLVILSAKC